MNIEKIVLSLFVIAVAVACANRASGPAGGPKDEIPPKVVKSLPESGALNFSKKIIQVYFDENIQLDKVQDNVVISPVQLTPPEITANGRLLTVNFQDAIKDSTTYSIQFGDAVVDLNEKNALKNFHFAFSSGTQIDTMAFSGYLLQAENLEPVAKTVVGVHSDLADSAVFTKAFERIAKTNEHGYFEIHNLKPGSYRLFALGDVNRDYKFQLGENSGFVDSLITPYNARELRPDTIWKDTVTIDTIKMVERTIDYPQNVVIRYFKDSRKRQFLVKSNRPESSRLTLVFNTKQKGLPVLKGLNADLEDKYLLQSSMNKDTLQYWLKDTTLINQDTLSMTVTYEITDSLWNWVSKTDTINFVSRKLPVVKGKSSLVVKKNFLEYKSNLSPSFDLNKSVEIHFNSPVDSVFENKIRLYSIVDSVRKELTFKLSKQDTIATGYLIHYAFEAQKSYELQIDSAAFKGYYNNACLSLNTPFKMKAEEDYAALNVVLNAPDTLGILQVLDSKENIIRSERVNPKGNRFAYMKPDSYFIRLIIDENQNGNWDSGSMNEKRQPETVYYNPGKVVLKANWDTEEVWDFKSIPILNQRPVELRKDIKKSERKDNIRN